ncbi:hypothetical protein D3C81_1761300 [compost metagenome]
MPRKTEVIVHKLIDHRTLSFGGDHRTVDPGRRTLFREGVVKFLTLRLKPIDSVDVLAVADHGIALRILLQRIIKPSGNRADLRSQRAKGFDALVKFLVRQVVRIGGSNVESDHGECDVGIVEQADLPLILFVPKDRP